MPDYIYVSEVFEYLYLMCCTIIDLDINVYFYYYYYYYYNVFVTFTIELLIVMKVTCFLGMYACLFKDLSV